MERLAVVAALSMVVQEVVKDALVVVVVEPWVLLHRLDKAKMGVLVHLVEVPTILVRVLAAVVQAPLVETVQVVMAALEVMVYQVPLLVQA